MSDRSTAARWNGAVGQVLAYSQAPPTARLVLVAIAHHADNASGRCHVSDARLAELTGLNRKTVKRAVLELMALGELMADRPVPTEGVRRRATDYLLILSDANPRLFDDGPAVPNRGQSVQRQGAERPLSTGADRGQSVQRQGAESPPIGGPVPPQRVGTRENVERAVRMVRNRPRAEVPPMLDSLHRQHGPEATAEALDRLERRLDGEQLRWTSALETALVEELTARAREHVERRAEEGDARARERYGSMRASPNLEAAR